MGYITNFIVYTLAMVGVIVVALLVFKNATSITGCKSSKFLKIIDTMSLGQRKMLYIVSTGKEEFLIAGDVDKTSLIAKLDNVTSSIQEKRISDRKDNFSDSFKATLSEMERPKSYMDKSIVGINSSILNTNKDLRYTSVIKSLAEKMQK